MIKNFRVNVNVDNFEEINELLAAHGLNMGSKPINLYNGDSQIRFTGDEYGYAGKTFYDKEPDYRYYPEFDLSDLYRNYGMLKIRKELVVRTTTPDVIRYHLNGVRVKVEITVKRVSLLNIILNGGYITKFALSLADSNSGDIKVNVSNPAVQEFLKRTHCI